MYLSTGAQKSLLAVLDDCGTDMEICELAAQNTLLDAGFNGESKRFGLILYAGGLLLAALAHILVTGYMLHESEAKEASVPPIAQIAAPIATSITAVQTPARLVVDTSSNAPVITVAVAELPTATITPVDPATLTGTAVAISKASDGSQVLKIDGEG